MAPNEKRCFPIAREGPGWKQYVFVHIVMTARQGQQRVFLIVTVVSWGQNSNGGRQPAGDKTVFFLTVMLADRKQNCALCDCDAGWPEDNTVFDMFYIMAVMAGRGGGGTKHSLSNGTRQYNVKTVFF